MASLPYIEGNGSTRTKDFLTFETPSYNGFNTDGNGGFKSHFDNMIDTSSKSTSLGGLGNVGNKLYNATLPDSANLQKNDNNFLLKGIEFVTGSQSAAKGNSNGYFNMSNDHNIFNNTGNSLSGKFASMINASKSVLGLSQDLPGKSWKTYTNYKIFLLLFGTSILFSVLSFMALPFIVFAPQKFGLLFTCASISFMASMSFLRGFGTLVEHLLDSSRIGFSIAYVSALMSTLTFTTIYQSYVMTFISSVIQLISLLSVVVSYIPGGSGALKMIYSSLWSYVTSGSASGGSNSLLPV